MRVCWPELLKSATKMPVETVHDGMEIEPNHVYVIPPNTSMELQGSTLQLVAREPGLHLPIDIFFRSLAEVQGSRAIGIVLSGNASDGSLGVRAIKAECGITFAQDEATARFSGMPRNAIATGAIDYVLPPAEIGRELKRLQQSPVHDHAQPGVAQSEILPEGDGDLMPSSWLAPGQHESRFQPLQADHHTAPYRTPHDDPANREGFRIRALSPAEAFRTGRAIQRSADQRHQLLP